MTHGFGTHIQWHHDDAIKTATEDCFERVQFAKDLTALLIQKGTLSTVISIEADWGNGKTSIINLIKENIHENHPNVVVIDFAPWLFSFASLEDLVRKFLCDLIMGLNILGCKSLTKLLKKYAGHYLTFPLQHSLKSLITSWISRKFGSPKVSIEALKKDINKILAQNDKPIVVIIDDIDRLQPKEIKMLFQLIKSICNFTGINYLLAYARTPVIQALSYNGIYDGDLYLEKIVQVVNFLPVISKFHLQKFLKKEIQKLFSLLNLQFRDYEKLRLSWLYHERKIINLLAKPRDVHQLVNQLKLILPTTHNQVNAADVIIHQILALKLPRVAELIRNHPRCFVPAYEADSYSAQSLHEEYGSGEIKPHIYLLKSLGLPQIEYNNALHTLNVLFNFQQEEVSFHSEDLRVSHPNHLQKLLHPGSHIHN